MDDWERKAADLANEVRERREREPAGSLAWLVIVALACFGVWLWAVWP